MYQKFILNQQAACRKSAMPQDYPPHTTNSSWLFDCGQTLAQLKKAYQKAKPVLHCNAVQY